MKVKSQALIDQLPFWHTDDDFMVYSDGSLGVGFRLKGVDISCATNNFVNDITSSLENLLGSTQEGLKIQFFYRLTPKVESLLGNHKELSSKAPEKYGPIAESRLNSFEKIAKDGSFFVPEVYLFVRGKKHELVKQKFWESTKKFEKISKKNYLEHKQKFIRAVSQIESSLDHAKLFPKILKTTDWFDLLFEYFNLSRFEKLGVPTLHNDETPFAPSFSSQLLLSDLHVHKDAIQIGPYYFRTLTLKNLPEGMSYASMVDGLLKGLPFHFWLSQSIEIHDQKKEMEKLQLSRRLAHSMASGAKNVSDLESESKLHHLESLISELLEGSQKIVSMDFNIMVWAKNLNELENKCDEVLQAYRNMGQSEGIIETLPALDSFLSCTPGPAAGFRYKKVKSSNCSHLMPIYSYWRGNKRPICLFQNREGGLFSFDPFSPELQNWNALIFGGSGAGKSFSILQMMLQFYGQNPTPRIVWIDNGASSERLLEKSVLDGQFIDLNLDSNICLNMFDLPRGDRVPSPSKIKLILAILETILKDDEQVGLPKRHKALVEEAIYLAYEKKSPEVPTLSDLKEVLADHQNIEMRNYAQILYSWTGDTAYGRLLDGKTNINLNKDLITIEIKGLDTYPDLQNAMLLNFTEFIKTTAAKDTSRPTLLIIDEAWKLFETPSGRAFTIEAYRTFRKFGGGAGIWCISQNYKDFLISDEISNAIFPNTTSIFVLKQSKIDWEDFTKRLQLNEAELEVAKSLQSVKGEYSELFLMQNDDRVVLRIQADPLAYYIATTDPGDRRKIVELEEKRPELNKMEILKILAKQKINQKAEVNETIQSGLSKCA